MLAADGPHRAGDRELVGQPKKGQIQKASREVQWRRQPSGLQNRSSAAGFDKEKLLVKLDPIRHAQAAVEIHQIDAAAQQDVLAVVDDFGCCRREPDKKWRGHPGIHGPQKDQLEIRIGPARQPTARPAKPPPITITDGMRN